MSNFKFCVGGRTGGRVEDYNAICVATTDQLRLGWVEVSWSAEARCGNIKENWTKFCPFPSKHGIRLKFQHRQVDFIVLKPWQMLLIRSSKLQSNLEISFSFDFLRHRSSFAVVEITFQYEDKNPICDIWPRTFADLVIRLDVKIQS